jgi:hypothetical protein
MKLNEEMFLLLQSLFSELKVSGNWKKYRCIDSNLDKGPEFFNPTLHSIEKYFKILGKKIILQVVDLPSPGPVEIPDEDKFSVEEAIQELKQDAPACKWYSGTCGKCRFFINRQNSRGTEGILKTIFEGQCSRNPLILGNHPKRGWVYESDSCLNGVLKTEVRERCLCCNHKLKPWEKEELRDFCSFCVKNNKHLKDFEK